MNTQETTERKIGFEHGWDRGFQVGKSQQIADEIKFLDGVFLNEDLTGQGVTNE